MGGPKNDRRVTKGESGWIKQNNRINMSRSVKEDGQKVNYEGQKFRLIIM